MNRADRTVAGEPASDLAARLDAAVAAARGDAAAYFDLDAGLVLGASSWPGLPQESLDALCRAAPLLLEGAEGGRALVASGLEMVVLQRIDGDDATALCLVLDPETPPGDARAAAARAVQAMARTGAAA